MDEFSDTKADRFALTSKWRENETALQGDKTARCLAVTLLQHPAARWQEPAFFPRLQKNESHHHYVSIARLDSYWPSLCIVPQMLGPPHLIWWWTSGTTTVVILQSQCLCLEKRRFFIVERGRTLLWLIQEAFCSTPHRELMEDLEIFSAVSNCL